MHTEQTILMRNTNLVFRGEVEAGDTLGNYQLRWKLKPWEMRSLREDEKGTENGTFYIIIVFSK